MIPETTLREIQDRLNIVEMIGGYLSLKKAGRNFKALCPFHAEKTPSFVIYPDKQFFICYGCGAGGDMITFVMKQEQLEFAEAVELLAEQAGVEIPQAGRGGGRKQNQELYQVQEFAASFYQDQLKNSAEAEGARTYLKKRGIDPSAWETFRLGYAPSQWSLLVERAQKEGLAPALLERGGLAMARAGGEGWYDRFRNRVIFPVVDARGRVIAFTGRVFREGDDGPKYMNSPETELYVKGRVLYGLNLAVPRIREKDFCIVVEGNLDVITPFQHGVCNIVAPMGTSLTEAQVKLLRRYTRHVVILYDGDAAGEAATLRGLDLFLEAEMRVKVAVLPGGYDPDSLIRTQGPEAFGRVLQQSQELFDYRLGQLIQRYDPKELEGRIRICQDLLPTLKKIPNAIQRGEYIRRLAQLLGVDEHLLWAELDRIRPDRADWKPRENLGGAVPVRAASVTAEEILAGLLLEDPHRVSQLEGRLDLSDLQDPDVRQLVAWLSQQQAGGEWLGDHQSLLNRLPRGSGEWEHRVARWMASADTVGEKDRTLSEAVDRIRERKHRVEEDRIREEIRLAETAGDHEAVVRWVSELNRRVKERPVAGSSLC